MLRGLVYCVILRLVYPLSFLPLRPLLLPPPPPFGTFFLFAIAFELGDPVQHGLNLCSHCVCQRLHAGRYVGGLLFLVNCCLCNSGNKLVQFVAVIGLGPWLLGLHF